jgi:hypothetical protein
MRIICLSFENISIRLVEGFKQESTCLTSVSSNSEPLREKEIDRQGEREREREREYLSFMGSMGHTKTCK